MGEKLVVCRSEYTYAERPVFFVWAGNRYHIKRIEAEWRTPQGKEFRVRSNGEEIFDLFYIEDYDEWQICPA